MLRGIAGRNIFIDDKDRIRLCLFLQAAIEKHCFLIHAFCFMDNHLHFILEPTLNPLHECVHAFASRYAQYFNRRHKKHGYLFQDRFLSILIDDGMYLQKLIRYIHLNPIEAFLTQLPEEYRWSSHRAYLGIDDYAWLTKEIILSRFGDFPSEALNKFAQFIKPLPEVTKDAKEILKSINVGIYGSNDFIKETSPILLKTSQVFTAGVLPLETAVNNVCSRFQVNINDLSSSSKLKHIVNARSVLALIGRIGKQNWNLQDVAALLNKNSGTLSRLASRAKAKPDLIKYVNELLSI